jgi:hypothetical protein
MKQNGGDDTRDRRRNEYRDLRLIETDGIPGEGEPRDEQPHGETDAGRGTDARDVAPPDTW